MRETIYFLSGVCVGTLLISAISAALVWLLAKHAPVMNCDEDGDR